jgi:hypothetical protein
MPAGIEHRVEVGRRNLGKFHGVRQCLDCLGIVLKAAGRVGLEGGLIALGVERRLAAFR